jgi:hypothetical protein
MSSDLYAVQPPSGMHALYAVQPPSGMHALPGGLIAAIGSRLDMQSLRSCLLASRIFATVTDDVRRHDWVVPGGLERDPLDLTSKLALLLKYLPKLHHLNVSFGYGAWCTISSLDHAAQRVPVLQLSVYVDHSTDTAFVRHACGLGLQPPVELLGDACDIARALQPSGEEASLALRVAEYTMTIGHPCLLRELAGRRLPRRLTTRFDRNVYEADLAVMEQVEVLHVRIDGVVSSTHARIWSVVACAHEVSFLFQFAANDMTFALCAALQGSTRLRTLWIHDSDPFVMFVGPGSPLDAFVATAIATRCTVGFAGSALLRPTLSGLVRRLIAMHVRVALDGF